MGNVTRRSPFGSNPFVGERGTDTQRRILDAALDVFAEVGFNDSGVELITSRAGCSRPAFYQYFSSKDDVFWHLASHVGREMVDLGRRLDGVDSGGFVDWVAAFTDLYERYEPVFVAFQAATRDHHELVGRSSVVSSRLADALLRGFGIRGRGALTRAVGAGLVAVLIRSTFYRLHLAKGVGRERVIDALAETVERVLTGYEADRRRPLRRAPALAGTDARPATASPRGERTRRRLLDAGAKVLPARGYQAARVDDIVEAAGVSHGSFYRYFANKDDFFRELAAEAAAPLLDLLERFPASGDAALDGWLDEWFTAYDRNGGIISTWQEMRTENPELTTFAEGVAASVTARLRAVVAGHGAADPEAAAFVLLAVLERLPYSAFTLEFASREDAVRAATVIIRRGFLAAR